MLRLSSWAVRLVLSAALLAPADSASAQAFTVVVNQEGPSSLSREEIARIFLKKSDKLTAVDLVKDSKIRPEFSKVVLGRPISAVLSYWQRQIFSGGDTPPVEKRSDAEVLAFVRSDPSAIGYVSAGAELGAGVKVVTIR